MLVEHHVKYKELHGVDETVWMTESEHRKLHFKLRTESKCNVPSEKLKKISNAACKRTDKYKKKQTEYYQRLDIKKRVSEYVKEYSRENIFSFHFFESMSINVRLHEVIGYNSKINTILYKCHFEGTNNHKLAVVNI